MAVHNGSLRWDKITPGLQIIRLHWITEPTATWTLPADHHHVLLTVQGNATIRPKEGYPVTPKPTHAVNMPPNEWSRPMRVHPGASPWSAIVITYPAPSDHTHTRQHGWADIHGDLLQEHLVLTRTYHTLDPMRRIAQAPHSIHYPGLWAYATPESPEGSGEHQGQPIHPANPDPNPTSQHPTRLHHLVGIPRPRHCHLRARDPPPWTPTPPTFQAATAAAAQVGAPETSGPQYLVKIKLAPHAKAQEKTRRQNYSNPHSNWTRQGKPPETSGQPTASSYRQPSARTTPPRSPSPITSPTPRKYTN